MSIANSYVLMLERQEEKRIIDQIMPLKEAYMGSLDKCIDDLIETHLEQKDETFFLISEELTDHEKYEAERMKGSGHDFYHRQFVSQHPNAEKAFYGQERKFGDKSGSARIGITLNTENMEPHPGVKEHLSNLGYKTNPELYSKGLAEKTIRVGNPEQGIPHQEKTVQKKIGSVLEETNAPEQIKKAYMNDPGRSGKGTHEFDLVLSHHPHDVYGMSTGRGWVSCSTMRKGCEKFNGQGPGAKKMKDEINGGTHVAYLVPKNGNVDTDAIARLAFKKHYPVGGGKETLIPENRVYGQAPNDFHKKASDEVQKLFPIDKTKIYKRSHDVYDDSGRNFVFHDEGHSIKSEDMDAAWNSLGKKDEIGKRQLYSKVDPQQKYKSKTLNSIAKTVREAHHEATNGRFTSAWTTLGNINLPDRLDEYSLIHRHEESPLNKHIDEIASHFDHTKPEHLELYKQLNERMYGKGNEIQQEIVKRGANRIMNKPVKTVQDAVDILSLRQYNPNNRTQSLQLHEKHELGRYPFKKIAQHLGEQNKLNSETASRLYFGLGDVGRTKGNYYDHVADLVKSNVPGASQTMDQIAHDYLSKHHGIEKREYSIAETLHHTKPENREMWANAFGVDHQELAKKHGPAIRKKVKEMNAYIEKIRKDVANA